MRTACTLVTVLSLLGPPGARAAEPGQTVIHSDYGSLTVMAILQGLFGARFDASELDRDGDGDVTDADDVFANDHYDFLLQRARVILKGHLLSPHLTYLFQGDAAVPGFLLDAKVAFTIPEGEDFSTTVAGGRMLPPFTLVLPRSVARLDAINYPLYLFHDQGRCPTGYAAACRQPFAPLGTIGRHVGITVTQKLTSMFQLDAGVTNGFRRSSDPNWTDDNDWKDLFVRFAARPLDGLLLAADFWAGFPLSLDSGLADDPATPEDETLAPAPFPIAGSDAEYAHDEAYFGVFEAEITMVEGLELQGEFALSRQLTHSMDRAAGPSVPADRKSTGLGGWFHAGYTFAGLLGAAGDLEAVARFDYYDPDVDLAGNAQMRLTLGPHLFLEGIHAQIRLNYLFNVAQSTRAADRQAWEDRRHELWLQAAFEI